MDLPVELFDYELPAAAIAQFPTAERTASRLLVVDRARRTLSHQRFSDLPRHLAAGDVLVRNNAAVLPARLPGTRPTGGAVECFLLRPGESAAQWHCLLRPGKKLPTGAGFSSEPAGDYTARVVGKSEDGTALVEFRTPRDAGVAALARRIGAAPLPPYLNRPAGKSDPADRERYQTVYADSARSVAVAAPTAGLHFSPALLAGLVAQGVDFADVTLHVGLGTFRPLSAARVQDHAIHHEIYEMPRRTQAFLRSHAGRRWAVGTTSVRATEDYLRRPPPSAAADFTGEASLFIYPPFQFLGADHLITNFHQPRSTLLCLVAAFLAPGSTDGLAWWREIYRIALEERYRFLSYGDAMLIL